ncbi:MAG TPA: protein kinase, partial [Thermoanaerobaculia bacterium]|nr:protein kinase [Thermoanaerobaculia bacterium]
QPFSPSKLGRYEIVEEIGKGAMGVVYLARDPLIGRLVALKTFRIGYSFKDAELEQFRARFIREAQSAGILSHPNIVTIHDVVERGDEGLAFIAMEYVRGTNLKSVLQEPERPALTYACDILTQIADGLDYAHSCKVIHRDIKPANILITTDHRAKITDFGIARLDTSNLTQEGQLLGTPNYMSPEQILGRDVDHRADIFSLGVVLYEMVTRHKPFQGDNLTMVSHRIVYDPPTPPGEYTGDLPPGAEQVLAKALQKEPGRRYQRARDMADDLRRVLGSVGVRDTLNETQSLSTTAILPAHLLRPAAPGGPGASAWTTPPASAPQLTAAPVAAAPAASGAAGVPHGAPAAYPASAAGGSALPAAALPAVAALAPVQRPSLWRRLTGPKPGPLTAVAVGGAPSAAVPADTTPLPFAMPPGTAGEAAATAPAATMAPAQAPRPVPQLAPAPLQASAPLQAPAAPGDAEASPALLPPASPAPYRYGTRPHVVPPELVAAGAAAVPAAVSSAPAPGATPPLPASPALPAGLAGQPAPVPATPVPPLPPVASLPSTPQAPPTIAAAAPPPIAAPASAVPAVPMSQWAPAPLAASGEETAATAAVPARLDRPPAAPGRGFLAMPSPVGLVVAVAAGLAVGLMLAGGLYVAARAGQAPAATSAPAGRTEAAQAIRVQVLGLLRDGRRRLDGGDADGAAAAFRAAEQLVPGRQGLRRLREEAERQQGDRQRRLDQERTIGAKLEEGRLALAGRHYDEAETAAQAVLTMSPGNTVAEEILTAVKAGRARTRDRLAALPRPSAVAASPAVLPAAAPAVAPPAAPPAAEAKDASLELAFFSELPEGTLILYVNDRRVLQESYRFYEKTGLFHRAHPETGWVRRSFSVKAGNANIRLYVTPHDSAAVVRTFAGNFTGGTSRRLDVKLTGSGEVTAQLN